MRRADSPGAFTLVEVLIGSALAAVLMAAVLSSFVFLGRSLTRLANHETLEAKARQALTYLRNDLALAQSVKSGTTPTASTVTLVLPAGEVTYTYDSTALNLHRHASFGANPDVYLLQNDFCSCPTFAFNYATTTNGPATSPITPGLYVPYSIKQVEVQFVLQTPGTSSPATQSQYTVVSAPFLLPNTQAPDGT